MTEAGVRDGWLNLKWEGDGGGGGRDWGVTGGSGINK